MIDPCLAVRTAIRGALVNTPAVVALVPADHIRTGTTRPDELPCLRISDGNCVMHGHAAGGQFVATVTLDVHVWALNDGADMANLIAAECARVLMNPPAAGTDFIISEFKHVSTAWPRDVDLNLGHGVLSIVTTIYWRL